MKKLLVLLVLSAALAVLLFNSSPVAADPPQPRPPDGRPGWVWVGNETTVILPNGSTVTLPDQSNLPSRERIAWVRSEFSEHSQDLTPQEAGIVGAYILPPPGQTQYWDYDTETTNFCNFWGYCAIAKDSSYVGYTKPTSSTVKIFVCYAKTKRDFNNPYGLPQFSYDKVKSFVYELGALWGDYEPDSGTAQADYWYEVSDCWTATTASSFNVYYGSKWDAAGNKPETYPANLVPGPS